MTIFCLIICGPTNIALIVNVKYETLFIDRAKQGLSFNKRWAFRLCVCLFVYLKITATRLHRLS